jgi:glycosyltransferase involved in cell wall biosynthesis
MSILTKKIAVFIPDLSGGGAEKVMLLLAGGMAERGYAVDLVLIQKKGQYLSQISSKINVIELGSSRAIFSIFALTEYLRQTKPACLLSAMPHLNIIAILAGKLAGNKSKIFISEHSLPSLIKTSGGFYNFIIFNLLRVVYPFAYKICAVSKGVAEDLSLHVKVKTAMIEVIYNPVIFPELAEMAKQPVAHKWLNKRKMPVILAVGRLHPIKDYKTLIKAFAITLKTLDARLIILGQGAEKEALTSLAEQLGITDKIDLHGFVQNPYAYMQKADVFVLSSKIEGLGNSLIEAMACGCAVISTNCPSGPSEILEGGGIAPMVAVGDEIAMAYAIINTLQTPPDKINLQNRAGYFTLNRAVNKYLQIMGL